MAQKELYKEEFWEDKREALSGLFGLPRLKGLLDFIYTRAGMLRAKDQAKWVLSSYKPRHILEIGCGYGGGIIYWHRKGYDINGLEPDRKSVERINKKLGRILVSCGKIESVGLKKKYDLLVLSHVIEHLPSLNRFFRAAAKVQADGGAVFVEVPNCEVKEVLHDSKENKAHVHHFTTKSLKNTFITHGYRIIKQETLISRIDLITGRGLPKIKRFARLAQVLLAKEKSVKAKSQEANVIRLIAVKE